MASTVLLRMYLAKLTSCWDFLPLCESRAVGARLVSASPLALPNTSGWSVTRKTEKPTENSKTRTEPKPKITDFSKTEPNRNRIQKPRLTEKGHFWKFWVKSGRKSEKILRFRLVLLKKHSNPKKFLQKCCKLSFKHLLALLKKCRILSQFLSTNADG